MHETLNPSFFDFLRVVQMSTVELGDVKPVYAMCLSIFSFQCLNQMASPPNVIIGLKAS